MLHLAHTHTFVQIGTHMLYTSWLCSVFMKLENSQKYFCFNHANMSIFAVGRVCVFLCACVNVSVQVWWRVNGHKCRLLTSKNLPSSPYTPSSTFIDIAKTWIKTAKHHLEPAASHRLVLHHCRVFWGGFFRLTQWPPPEGFLWVFWPNHRRCEGQVQESLNVFLSSSNNNTSQGHQFSFPAKMIWASPCLSLQSRLKVCLNLAEAKLKYHSMSCMNSFHTCCSCLLFCFNSHIVLASWYLCWFWGVLGWTSAPFTTNEGWVATTTSTTVCYLHEHWSTSAGPHPGSITRLDPPNNYTFSLCTES